MRQEEFVRVINRQEEINQKRVRQQFIEMLDEEFVLEKRFIKHLEHIEKSKQPEAQALIFQEWMQSKKPVTKKLKEFDISKQMKGQSMFLHQHTYIEIDYVYQGYCDYHIANEEQVFRLEAKQLCIVNQNIVHGIDVLKEETTVIKCMVPFSFLDVNDFSDFGKQHPLVHFLRHSLQETMASPGYMIYNVEASEWIEELLYGMFVESYEKKGAWRQVIKNRLSDLLITLMRSQPTHFNHFARDKEKLNIPQILEIIRKNYKDLTLTELAQDLHFHENYLSKKIKEHIHLSFQEYVLEVRMKEAERLLKDTTMPIKNIATEIGYKNPGFFYKTFKERYGITPAMYRAADAGQRV